MRRYAENRVNHTRRCRRIILIESGVLNTTHRFDEVRRCVRGSATSRSSGA
jgi:hypothetical protein